MAKLIVCPLKKELSELVHFFKSKGEPLETYELGKLSLYYLPDKDIFLGRGGLGKTQMAIVVHHYLHHLKNIDLVVCAGCGGALSGQLDIGDIVVGEKIIEHDFKSSRTNFNPPEFLVNPKWLQSFSRIEIPSSRILCGAIASGDEDIASRERAAEVVKLTGALVVAWEGAGAARAAEFFNIDFIEVRSIVDVCENINSQDFAHRFTKSMSSLANFISLAFS